MLTIEAKLLCRIIHDRESQRRVCGVRVRKVMQKDIGKWICLVRAKDNWKDVGGKYLTVQQPPPEQAGKQCTETTFKAKFAPTKKL